MAYGKWSMLVVGLAATLGGSVRIRADEPTMAGLERQFHELPAEARRLTGPLFWLHGDESRERLEASIGKVAEGGNGTFTAESRPHRDWLGEGWFRDLGVCLEAAKWNNLTLWIFDEKWWPSQEVGGMVPARYGSKRLVARAVDIAGPKRVTVADCAGPNLLAVVAGKSSASGIDGRSLVDLTSSVRGGKLTWDAPEGSWKIMTFAWELAGGRRILVDGASRDCVDWFLRTVYQPHYDRFKDDFGKTIVGFFYDEPETHGDWGTEVPRVLEEKGVDWKQAYVGYKFGLEGEARAAAKYAYLEALGEAWGRTLYGGITRWCRERGVASIGHFLEHNHEYLRLDECAGNMVQLQKYSTMGAIDAVFKQFVPGRKDDSTYQTPKLGSSISHAYGKADDLAMVEIFGARGQDLTYPEMKWWTDLMQVEGINFLIPHSFNPRAPYDTDCPPYFDNGGFEPRWPLYRVFADYTSRLSLMLTGGRHECPVAILFPGYSVHVGRAVPPEVMTTALQDALFDCDWLPYEVFENDATVSGSRLQLRDEGYRVLVVPPVEVIPAATLAKARRFFEAGGVVVGYGFLPSRSATLGVDGDTIARLREAIWGDASTPGTTVRKVSPAGGRSFFLPEKSTPEEIQEALTGSAEVHPALEVVQGRTNHWLHVLHRIKAGRDVFLVCNQTHQGQAERFRFRVRAEGIPECWDAMRNTIESVPFERKGDSVELSLSLEPLESVLLVFQPEARPRPRRREHEPSARPARRTIPVVRESASLASSVQPPPPLVPDSIRRLEGCSWVWYPEGRPAEAAPPGTRYFRTTAKTPVDRAVTHAAFLISADNDFVLYANGAKKGQGGGGAGDRTRPAEIDLTTDLRPGTNVLGIAATNGGSGPNPAGLIGRLIVEFDRGESLSLPIDATWKAADAEHSGWLSAGFDDVDWPAAREAAPYGGGPWGRMTGAVPTLSPVRADPFAGQAEIPGDLDVSRVRVDLEMDAIAPEAAARITINGRYAGGFIGRPFRLDVTGYLRNGRNTVIIEPFAPASARLVAYPGP
jgi:hypothetical protein